jgi:hypothetical protein
MPHKTDKRPAMRSSSHTRSSSTEDSRRNHNTEKPSPPRSQSKTRRSSPSASSADSSNHHGLDSENLLKPSVRLTELTRRVSGEIYLLKKEAIKENIEVKKRYYGDEGEGKGESKREDVKSDTPKRHPIDRNNHEINCENLRKVTARLSKGVKELTNDVTRKRVETS